MNDQPYRTTGFRMLPPVVKNLLIINGLFFAAMLVLARGYDIDLISLLGVHYFKSDKFEIYQLVTYMFMHGGFWHIALNMFVLWMFGSTLENTWGPKKFLIFYFVTGIGAALFNMLITYISSAFIQHSIDLYLLNPTPDAFLAVLDKHFDGTYNPAAINEFMNQFTVNPKSGNLIGQSGEILNLLLVAKLDVPSVGASGAVYGILLAFGMLFPNVIIYFNLIFPMKAKWFVLLIGGIELVTGIMNRAGDNIGHFAHLGGMLFGLILILIWRRMEKRKQFNW